MKTRPLLRRSAYALAGFLLLILLLLLALGYLLHSPGGTRWLLEQARERVPGELQIDSLQGSFSGPLQIEGLSYRRDELRLQLPLLRLDWTPRELLQRRLHIKELTLRGARLQLPAAQPDSDTAPAEPFQGVALPLAIQLDALRVQDFQLRTTEAGDPIILEHLNLSARAGADEVIHLEQLEAAAFSARVQVAGKLQLSPELPMQLRLEWRYQPPDAPALSGSGEIHGDLDELEVRQSAAAPVQSRLQATVFDLLSAPRWETHWQLEAVDLGAFTEAFPARLQGTVQSRGTPDDLEAQARLQISDAELGEFSARVQSRYRQGTLVVERLALESPAGAQLTGQGRYTPDDAQGKLSAELSWKQLRWPLQGETVALQSPQGQMHVEGSPSAYQYRLAMHASRPDLPKLQLESSGNGDLQHLEFSTLRLELGEGHLQGAGRVSWDPELTWQASLNGEALDPGLLHADFPGRLALALETDGRLAASGPQADLRLKRLEGVLREYPVKASGEIQLRDQTLDINRLQVHSGENRIRVSGRAGEQLDLDWSIRAPQLEAFWPGLGGRLDASGRLAGARQAPRIKAEIEAGELAFEENRIGKLRAMSDIDLAGGQQIDLQLDAERLHSAGMSWRELQLQVAGTRSDHHIELDLQGQDVPQGSLVIDAGLSRENLWSGTLQRLRLQLPELHNWRLVKPTAFQLGAQQQRLSRTCLASEGAELCGNFDGTAAQGWQARLQGEDLALALLQPWLPERTRLAGEAVLQAAFSADAKGAIQGNAELRLPNGEFVFEANEQPQTVDLSGAYVQTRLDAQGGGGEWNIPMAGLGAMEGRIRLPGLRPTELQADNQPLSGRLQANIDELGILSAFAPNLQKVRGRIEADFELAGTLAAPRLRGAATLNGGALDIPAAGLELRKLSLRVQAADLERLQLEGSVKSGKGELTLQGQTRLLAEAGFPTEINIRGEDWRVIDIPEAEILISPDIQVSYDAQRSAVTGEVKVPYARIRPRKMPKSAVSGTSDLVIEGQGQDRDTGQPQPPPPADPEFHARLRIVLGDRVSFEGMGLRAQLTGNLLVIDEPGRPVTGSGRISVTEGTYQAYGQNLKIERGEILFADSPVDNPGLNVRAVREVEDVTAGVRVTGTLKNPELEVFSEPAMGETAALSYLLTGRGPGEGGESNLSVMDAVKAGGAGKLTSEIGRRLGLEELRVETGSTLEEASVVAGTYLSPRLYVQYVNEVATSETKLRLRYDMTERLQIQTESGSSQGVDFFYTIER